MPKILLAYPIDIAAAILAANLATEDITNEGRIAKKTLRESQTLPREHLIGCQGCHNLTFVTIWILSQFEFCHNLTFVTIRVLSHLDFLFYFCHNLIF